MFRRFLMSLAFSALVVGTASAAREGTSHGARGDDWKREHDRARDGSRVITAPEFDPTAAGAVAAILGAGGIFVARRRGR
jgi:hypothetical protein